MRGEEARAIHTRTLLPHSHLPHPTAPPMKLQGSPGDACLGLFPTGMAMSLPWCQVMDLGHFPLHLMHPLQHLPHGHLPLVLLNQGGMMQAVLT